MIADRPVSRLPLVFAVVAVVVHLPFLAGYGYHRDELYFLACGAHLDWGFADHPPLVPALAALAHAVFGDSVFGLRLLPCLAGGATVYLAGVQCRELGGGRYAQGLTCLCVLLSPFSVRTGNVLAIPSFEPLFWTACSVALCRALRGAQQGWLAFGCLAGIGMLNKHTVLLYGFAVTVGLLATRHRRELARPGPWLGALVAFAFLLPNVLWQIEHDWATLEFVRGLNERVMSRISRVDFLAGQVLYAGLGNALIWIPGVVWLLARRDGPGRVLGVAFVTVLAVLLVAQSKVYYSMPIYPVAFAAGGVFWQARAKAARGLALTVVVGLGAVFVPLGLPVLPLDEVDGFVDSVTLGLLPVKPHELTGDLHDMDGWLEQVDGITAAYSSLPAAERARCLLLVRNYGQAGAIELWGPHRGLPPVLCRHLSFHFWSRDLLEASAGRLRDGSVVLAFGLRADALATWFRDVEPAGIVPGGQHALRGERDQPLYLCRDPIRPLVELWPPDLRF